MIQRTDPWLPLSVWLTRVTLCNTTESLQVLGSISGGLRSRSGLCPLALSEWLTICVASL